MPRRRIKEFKVTYKNTQIKLKNAMPEALAALQQIIKLLEAAQVPLMGGALFSVASELIQCINGMRSNEETCVLLLQTILDYTKRIDRFISLMPPGFLDDPDDGSARVVRECLEELRLTLERAKPAVEKHSNTGRFLRFFTQEAMKDSLLQCQQKLEAARKAFNDTMDDVNLAGVLAQQRVTDVLPAEDLGISGAVALPHTSLGTLEPLDEFTPPQVPSFWDDFFKVEIRGEIRAVKLYHKDDRIQALKQDLKMLADNMTASSPQIFGYNQRGSPAFIAFKRLPVATLAEHLIYLQTNKLEDPLITAWNFLLQLNESGKFLRRNNPEMGWIALSCAFRFSVVDSSGRVIVVPDPRRYHQRGQTDWMDCPDATTAGHKLTSLMWNKRLVQHDPRLRRYRPLALALFGNYVDMLSVSKKVLKDPFSAKRLLRQLWKPPGEGRYLPWPGSWTTIEPLEIGDVGFFEAAWENRGVTDEIEHRFRKLGNVSTEVGEFEVKVRSSCVAERVQAPEVAPYIWRKTLFPSQDPHAIQHYSAQWRTSFVDPSQVWNYWVQNSKKIAQEHGMRPENLILVTETLNWSNYLKLGPWEETKPITAYTYANKNGRSWLSYWTYANEPLLPAAVDYSIGASYKLNAGANGRQYLQLEPEDLENVGDVELGNRS